MLIFLVTILNWSKLTSKSQQGWKFMFYDESITLNSKQFFSSHLWASYNSWGMNFLFYSFSRAAVMMVEGKAHTRAEKNAIKHDFFMLYKNDFCFKDLQLFPLLVSPLNNVHATTIIIIIHSPWLPLTSNMLWFSISSWHKEREIKGLKNELKHREGKELKQ